MEGKKTILKKYSYPILLIIFVVGTIGHLLYTTRELMILLTPYTLILTMGLVFYSLLNTKNIKLLFWFILTYLITFLIEVVGVKTGVIFGNYIYGNTLGIKVFDVPLLIGLNWVFVIFGSILIAEQISKKIIIIILISSTAALTFDIILEPVAIKLDYWNWVNGNIPTQNYIAWFVISLIATTLFILLKIKIKSDLTKNYFMIQLLFFLILNLFL